MRGCNLRGHHHARRRGLWQQSPGRRSIAAFDRSRPHHVGGVRDRGADPEAAICAAGFFTLLLSFFGLPFSIFMGAGQDTLPHRLWIQSGAHNATVPRIHAKSILVAIMNIGPTFLSIKLAFGGGRHGDE